MDALNQLCSRGILTVARNEIPDKEYLNQLDHSGRRKNRPNRGPRAGQV
jgi:hypothetical protein